MNKQHTIIMIASPRTGSTRLTALLTQFNQLNALGELFNPRNSYTRSDFDGTEILRKAGKIQRDDPKEAWAYCRSSPVEALSTLHESNGKTNVVKLAPKHLPDENVKNLFKESACGLIFLTRNPIDSYISLKKSQAIPDLGRCRYVRRSINPRFQRVSTTLSANKQALLFVLVTWQAKRHPIRNYFLRDGPKYTRPCGESCVVKNPSDAGLPN